MKIPRLTSLRPLIALVALLAVLAGSLVFGLSQAPRAYAASANTALAAGTQCKGYDFWQGAAAGWYHENSGGQICWNGSQIWQSGGGPSCSIIAYPPYTVNITWCGIYNSGGSYIDVGINANWSFLWGGNWPCYMRVRVNSNGQVVSGHASC